MRSLELPICSQLVRNTGKSLGPVTGIWNGKDRREYCGIEPLSCRIWGCLQVDSSIRTELNSQILFWCQRITCCCGRGALGLGTLKDIPTWAVKRQLTLNEPTPNTYSANQIFFLYSLFQGMPPLPYKLYKPKYENPPWHPPFPYTPDLLISKLCQHYPQTALCPSSTAVT